MTTPSVLPEGRAPRTDRAPDELAQFFGVLAARLAQDRVNAGISAVPAKPRPRAVARRRFFHRLPGLAAGLAGLLLVLFVAFPRLADSADLPDEMLGTWRTPAAGYANRGFTITRNSLTLHAGQGGSVVTTHRIIRVDVDHHGDEAVYTIKYESEDGSADLAVRYLPGRPATARLLHPVELVWTRDSTRS
ncbi:MAG: hypothetical protein ABI765_03230 [Gemmatimonadota bacterium]